MIKAALAAMALALAACAGSPAKIGHPPEAVAAPPAASVPDSSAAAAPPPADTREVMISNALFMLGQPYRFGGSAPGGFDCSGLVVYAAGGAGIRVPRTAAEQLGFGAPVARGDLRAGDLVFMHLARKELHVGIALDQERFIHAPSSGGYVRVDSLAAAPYARGYVSARRIIAAP